MTADTSHASLGPGRNNKMGPPAVIIAHVSYAHLAFTAAVHVMTAFGLSLFLTDFIKIQPIFAFPLAYLSLVLLTSYLVLRNGRWAVDGRFLYKGWRRAIRSSFRNRACTNWDS